ncbi:DUF485 domain-containing protein [Streptomyces roseolilacinus]|uniref:Membrane protein n=1 Tax=Streptomyces roseolilacinus TaxID=66904 RepID=A0A918EKK0_9ACTN|nr:DUF485 domain-containing protein [Streptomyces roseolilacinus]GGP98793.1 membrane protein [Streptomyces roseolilacinus]
MDDWEGRDAAATRGEDPWRDVLASEWGGPDAVTAPGGTAAPAGREPPEAAAMGVPVPRPPGTAADGERRPSAAEVYLEVQRSPAFQEVRGRYRRFVGPATLAFLTWYLGYVVAATAAPGLMSRPVLGAVNVAMVAGLGQFATTFALAWAYARHARVHRDRAALDLRWETQQMTREARVDR